MAEEEAKKILPPAPVEVPLQFYIDKATTYFGKALVEELSAPASSSPDKVSVTAKVQHKFFTSDPTLSPSAQNAVSGLWKV